MSPRPEAGAEVLANDAKHAGASAVDVTVSVKGDPLQQQVTLLDWKQPVGEQ